MLYRHLSDRLIVCLCVDNMEYRGRHGIPQGKCKIGNKTGVDICEEDLDMVRDQIITVEVNIARVFNHDVVRRRQAKGEVEA